MSYQIHSYTVTLPNHPTTLTMIGLMTTSGQYLHLKIDNLERAAQTLDILRNESPVFTDGRGTIYTGKEPIGEDEGK